MQNSHFITALLLFTAITAAAQVSVEVVLEQDQYLRDESLPVRVKITNRSGRVLNLGREADWLTFNVERRDGGKAPALGDAPVWEEFTLGSSMVATREVDIAPYFDLSSPGHYMITATVKLKELQQEIPSRPKRFEIARGVRLWDQIVGVPNTNGPPELRRFILHQAQLKRLTLYVRISDEGDLKTYRLLPVGPLVSFSRPEPQIDEQSNLHLLFQTGARSFNYTVVSPMGVILSRQTHDYAGTRPVLKSDESGAIFVSGGQRRFAADDLPSSATAISTNNVAPAAR